MRESALAYRLIIVLLLLLALGGWAAFAGAYSRLNDALGLLRSTQAQAEAAETQASLMRQQSQTLFEEQSKLNKALVDKLQAKEAELEAFKRVFGRP
jgi:uncharacterized protein HemX